MARKTAHQPAASQRNAMIVLVAGVLAIAALVGWALTRTVEPSPPVLPTTAPPERPPQPVTQTTTPPPDNVPRMTPEELRQRIDRGEVTVIDVRDANSYMASHIPGSLHIPFASVEGEIPYLPKSKPIVTYCT